MFVTELLTKKQRDVHRYLIHDLRLYCTLRRELVAELRKRKVEGTSSCGYTGVLYHMCCMMEGIMNEDHGLMQEEEEIEKEEQWSDDDEALYEEYKTVNVGSVWLLLPIERG